MKRKWFLLCSLLLALMLAVSPVALADAGGFSGDSDWGGGSSGGSDWSSDSDYDSGSTYYYGGSDGDSDGGGGWGGIIIGVIVVAVILIVSARKNKGGKGGKGGSGAPVNLAEPKPADLSALLQRDPNFSEAEFLESVGNLYLQMQNAWQQKDWEPMRMHLSDALYNQMGRQLDMLKKNGQTNYMERIAVLSKIITNYAQDDKNDILTCYLQVRLVDYTVDDATGSVVSGSKTAEKFLAYEWTLTRTAGMLTEKQGSATVQYNCKSCGAPLSVNHSAKCEYCGAVLTASEHDWVLNNIRGLWQRTGGK